MYIYTSPWFLSRQEHIYKSCLRPYIYPSSMPSPLAPDPIRVQSCVYCLFWTSRNSLALTSIFLSISFIQSKLWILQLALSVNGNIFTSTETMVLKQDVINPIYPILKPKSSNWNPLSRDGNMYLTNKKSGSS